MEIERKFLLERFPEHLPLLESAQVEQGYLSLKPEVRIRSKTWGENQAFWLCIKGEGTLVREEVELPLKEEEFLRLKQLLPRPMLHKDYRVYQWEGHRLECSWVDREKEHGFLYAEVEFPTVEEAKAFNLPDFLGREVTQEGSYRMKSYWEHGKVIPEEKE